MDFSVGIGYLGGRTLQGGRSMAFETAFTMDTSSIKYGPGVTREVGNDMKEWGTHRVMVVTDPNLTRSQSVTVTLDALRKEGLDAVLFDRLMQRRLKISFWTP
jgi:hydroxyacid-oxoacid transhydrogenase